MAVYEIPLSPRPQTFEISLAGQGYKLTLAWRDAEEGGWMLDIATTRGAPIVQGIPLVAGVDLLAQYAYLGIGGGMVVQTDNDPEALPTFEDLGETSHLYFITS